MPSHPVHAASRRRLLQFLAASQVLARAALAEGLRPSEPVDWAPCDLDQLIAGQKQALDVFDFEPVTKKNVPPGHFGYMASMTRRPCTPTARFSEICAAPATARRRQQYRHAHRNPRHDV